MRSKVVKVKDNAEKVGSGKPSVHVDLSLHQVSNWCALADLSMKVLLSVCTLDDNLCGAQAQPGGGEKLLATATGIFKKLGALRAL